MPDLVQVALGSLILAMFAISLTLWIRIAARWRSGEPIVPAEPREVVPWKAIDLYIVLVLYLAAQMAAAKLVIQLVGHAPAAGELDGENLAPVLASNAIANVLVVLCSVVYLRLRHGPHRWGFGFLPWRPGYDGRLGIQAFAAALTPVFAIQFVLTRWFKSEHPVQVLMSENSSAYVLMLCFVSAVVVAPLAEEFLFRVLLQGWMEAVATRWQSRKPGIAPESLDLGSDGLAGSDPPELAPAELSPTSAVLPNVQAPRLMPGPILLSSLAFALVHWGHGPDPIPLFVFALILGYLYQKTHRIWPSLVLHACLNAWSLTMLWISLKLGLNE